MGSALLIAPTLLSCADHVGTGSPLTGRWAGYLVGHCPDTLRAPGADTVGLVFDMLVPDSGACHGYQGTDLMKPAFEARVTRVPGTDSLQLSGIPVHFGIVEHTKKTLRLRSFNTENGCSSDFTMKAFTGNMIPLLK